MGKERLKGEAMKEIKSVGSCPVCGRTPTWFNDLPLKAFCWGTDEAPHPEARKIVPYADGIKTRWVISKI